MNMKRKTRIDSVQRAVLANDVKELMLALERGEEVNLKDQDGRTPLFQAAVHGNTALASELIPHGADVNAKDNVGETPLHFAAREYRINMARFLLEHGAQVNAQDIHGNTALARAVFASEGRGGMIKLLLQHSADKSLKNKYGVSAEDLAKSISNYDVIQFLS